MRELLHHTEQSVLTGTPFDRTACRSLYDVLIKPFEARIRGKTLIVVPDGILARLPFDLLIGSEGDETFYLIERHRVKYVQSASVLAMLRSGYRKEGLSDRFIGFGDPVYDFKAFLAGKPESAGDAKERGSATAPPGLVRTRYGNAGGTLGRLIGSGDEIRAIEAIFQQSHKRVRGLLRIDAREDAAKAGWMRDYGYIHFSTHGIVNARLQAIALSQIPGDKDDGFLTLGEIMNCRYNARLVVLSACQTGLGSMERGEGVTGLTRAVMYAGSPAALVSLWSVSDQGTRELMTRFYDNMIGKGMTKAEALRLAKLSMLKSGYRHPFFWAAFVMYGE